MYEYQNTGYAITGSGTGGLGAYSRFRRQTDDSVMIQCRAKGANCASVGGLLSKMLNAVADHAHEIHHGAPFGIHVEPSEGGERVFQRIRTDRQNMAFSLLSGQ